MIAALLLGFGLCLSPSFAQHAETAKNVHPARNGRVESQRTVTADDGLSVIAAALDPKVRRHTGQDCSHLVHAIYNKAGFPYSYATSDDLYDGVEGFLRVSYPQPGDVVVWPGHAGIVVRPSRHVFFSFMRSGPGISDYESRSWAGRGQPRFYRYLKNARCADCTASPNSHPTGADE
jgi:cell wall-associated NlpC family hydrolase